MHPAVCSWCVCWGIATVIILLQLALPPCFCMGLLPTEKGRWSVMPKVARN